MVKSLINKQGGKDYLVLRKTVLPPDSKWVSLTFRRAVRVSGSQNFKISKRNYLIRNKQIVVNARGLLRF